MVALYVANPTNQHQVVSYRLEYDRDGNKEELRQFRPASQQPIAPGQQAILGDRGFHQSQVNAIIRQLEPYGMVRFDDLGKVGRGAKITYIYREDLPVPAEVMRRVDFHNRNAKMEDGAARRAAAAVATNETVQAAVERNLLEQGITDHVPADSTSVAFETVQQPDDQPSDSIAEGFDIVPDGKVGPHSGKPAKPTNKRRGK